jgi:hypothetical protein
MEQIFTLTQFHQYDRSHKTKQYLCEMLWGYVKIYRPCKLESAVVANIFDLETFLLNYR